MNHAASPTIRESVNSIMANKVVALTILVSALGYFVDIFDLLLFSIVRVQSLKGLGVAEADLLPVGVYLINAQMLGLLVGGFFWGVLGDKYGRVSVLMASILLYSIGNICNGFVQTVDQYAIVRFITGVGLAGELGCGITLASEMLPKNIRGLGATFISFVGILGATLAYYVANKLGWREAYIVGGVMGLGLLALRAKVKESDLYHRMEKKETRGSRGNMLLFLKKPELLKKYIFVVLVGAPLWAVVGIFITFSPEFAKALGMTNIPDSGIAVLMCYGLMAFAGLYTGVLSQQLRSRKKAIFYNLLVLVAATVLFVTIRTDSLPVFYVLCGLLGVGSAYWAMFVQVGAEQFGTNIRATAAVSIPNVVRGLVVPMTMGFQALIPSLGILMSGVSVMAVMIVLALVSLSQLSETFHSDLDYIEGQN